MALMGVEAPSHRALSDASLPAATSAAAAGSVGDLSPWRGGRVGDGDAQGATVAGRTSGADQTYAGAGRWKTRRASAGGAGDSARAGGAMPINPVLPSLTPLPASCASACWTLKLPVLCRRAHEPGAPYDA